MAMIFRVIVKEIKNSQNVSQIAFSSPFGDFVMLGLETPTGLEVGKVVNLGFKSADLVVAKQNFKAHTHNIFKAKISSINRGEIITCLNLLMQNGGESVEFEALICSDLADDLCQNDEIWAYLAETSLFIKELL